MSFKKKCHLQGTACILKIYVQFCRAVSGLYCGVKKTKQNNAKKRETKKIKTREKPKK